MLKNEVVMPQHIIDQFEACYIQGFEPSHIDEITNDIKCVVPLSGGKDSQACLELALESFKHEEILAMVCDTRFENPKTIEHIKWMRGHYGVQFHFINNGDVIEQIFKNGRFPSSFSRFCTNALKIKPGKEFYKVLAEKLGHGFEVWYGMRSEESVQRRTRYQERNTGDLIAPHEMMKGLYPKYLASMGVMFRLPILDMTEEDVFDMLDRRENPLYDEGMGRVGCFPCLAGGDRSIEEAFAHDEVGKARKIMIKDISNEIQRNVFRSKGGKLRNPDMTVYDPTEEPTRDLGDNAPCWQCNI